MIWLDILTTTVMFITAIYWMNRAMKAEAMNIAMLNSLIALRERIIEGQQTIEELDDNNNNKSEVNE